ncbi:hypothetical protein SDC9_154114 [bioreactor metagenome]|uniref:Uncharacterized protein n=1 Tax=bioreactor metagenome TaxID=1076179 RepID=A0A645EY62_9ZZZZ
MEGYAALFEALLQNRNQFRVVFSGDVVEHLDDRHLRTDRGKVARKLQPDHAAADDDEVLRLLGERKDFPVGADETGG